MTQKLPINLQLYTVRDHTKTDMAGTLRKVAEMGYDGVELAGTGNLSREELKKVLDETGLNVTSAHSPWDRFHNELDDVIAEAKYLNFDYVVLPVMPGEQRGSAQSWADAARSLNEIGKKLKEHNLQLCYHNHAYEFDERHDGKYALDILFEAGDPQLLQSEMDTYWVKKGGPEVVDYIQKYAGRIPLLHIKDMDTEGNFAEIANGTFDWDAIFAAAQKAGVVHYIVEQDICPGDSLDSARLSINNLKAMNS